MTPEELDEATVEEAKRRINKNYEIGIDWPPGDVARVAARLAREGWTPPEPVDPDLLAFREWAARGLDQGDPWMAFLAGARMAREREQERAKVLLDYAWEDVGAPGGDEAKARSNRAFDVITKYEKGGQ